MQEKAKQIIVDYVNSQNIKNHKITHDGDKNEIIENFPKSEWENDFKKLLTDTKEWFNVGKVPDGTSPEHPYPSYRIYSR